MMHEGIEEDSQMENDRLCVGKAAIGRVDLYTAIELVESDRIVFATNQLYLS